MENWLHHLDADTPRIPPFQLKWDQQQLVLSHSGLQWAVEVSDGGAPVQERVIGPALEQPRHGPERSNVRGKISGGDQKQTRIEPPTLATGLQKDGKPVRIVTLTVPTLSLVDTLLTESQKWDSDTLINRQILMDEGPWRDTDMTIAWELYFQAQGLAPGARCEQTGCSPKQPHVILAKADRNEKQRQLRRRTETRHRRDQPDPSRPTRPNHPGTKKPKDPGRWKGASPI